MFEEQAEEVAHVLDIAITSRDGAVKMAGVPHRSVREYVRTLVDRGYHVAMAEQMEDPGAGKGIVRREVIEIITPGADVSDALESRPEARRIAVVSTTQNQPGGWIAALDVSTGEIRIDRATDTADLERRLARLEPAELVTQAGVRPSLTLPAQTRVTEVSPDLFSSARGAEAIARLGWTLPPHLAPSAVTALGAALAYVEGLLPGCSAALQRLVMEDSHPTMRLDARTVRHLEMLQSSSDTTGPTLRSVLDQTRTAGGRRLLREWMLRPLDAMEALTDRQAIYHGLMKDTATRLTIRLALDGVRDLHRLSVRLRLGRMTPREMRALGDSLARLSAVSSACGTLGGRMQLLGTLCEGFDVLSRRITSMLVERPPLVLNDPQDRWLQDTATADLQAAIKRLTGGGTAMIQLVARLKADTKLPSLKAGEGRGMGWYLEVPKAHTALVPSSWRQVATMSNAVRYRPTELEEEERQLYRAGDHVLRFQQEAWDLLKATVLPEVVRITAAADALAEMDVYVSVASVGSDQGWVMPQLRREPGLDLRGAWHPVVAASMPRDQYTPAEITLHRGRSLLMVTGPNMGGKSTMLRTVALVQVLAQMGGPVPAAHATVGLADGLWTRIGAGDALARGESTFMVEMQETAGLLNASTDRSLIILDELGRGTSTVDGLSIAWAVVETLAARGARTLFATHYHELIGLAERLPTADNVSMAVADDGKGGVRFLHEIRAGGSDQSYGIHVATLAGVPSLVVVRAKQVQHELLRDTVKPTVAAPVETRREDIITQLCAHPADHMTPIQALDLVRRLQQSAISPTE